MPIDPTLRSAPLDLPIGVFDSGVGGLTVLSALKAALPGEAFLYLGDTARLPYGTKSPASVVRYASQCAALLVARGIKALVVACNTAASAALPALAARYAGLPVVGVIEPGARAAVAASPSGRIAVIATEGTIRAGAYVAAIERLNPAARVTGIGCSVFVALAEEGWTTGPIVAAVAHRYLDGAFAGPAAPDTLLLGCTHFPVLAGALRAAIPPAVTLVDSARTTAEAVATRLAAAQLGRPATAGPGATRLLATDGPERFARVGSIFLGHPLTAGDVELVDV
ncbi:MAG TPA: glutamate racemase [Steroidobacteraceae bacterium]|nr:glutamate racemase [Steroidobacteraceae bacterium]